MKGGCPIGCGCAKGGLNPAGCCIVDRPGAAPGKVVFAVDGACQFGPPVLLCGAGAVHWCCILPAAPIMFPLVKENESTNIYKRNVDKHTSLQ